MEPFEPIERIESSDHSDQRDPRLVVIPPPSHAEAVDGKDRSEPGSRLLQPSGRKGRP
jgi:hypothetical protein